MLLFVFSMMFACVKNVQPGADGVHRVVLFTDDKEAGTVAALRQAKRYCKKDKQEFAVDRKKIDYICEMDEADYIRAKNLAQAAQVAGNMTSMAAEEDSTQESIGDVLATGGVAAEASLGECYKVKLVFQCID
jgi:acyl-CoA hydrolase